MNSSDPLVTQPTPWQEPANRFFPLILTAFLTVFASSFIFFLVPVWNHLVWLFRAPRFPTINPGGFFSNKKAVKSYLESAHSLYNEGRAKFSGPFYVNTDLGSQLILGPEHIQAVAREKNLEFTEFIGVNFFAHLTTFRTFQNSRVMMTAISKLTQRLPVFVKPMSSEVSRFLTEAWGSSTEWVVRPCREDIVQMIARLSARCFISEEMARNPEWIKIAIDHAIHAQEAAEQLRLWPAPLRYLADKFLPLYRGVRAEHRRAAAILKPVMEARQAELRAAAAEGRAPKLGENMFEFGRTTVKNEVYSEVNLQLQTAFSAIQTSADILAQAVLFLGKHPEYQQVLREETFTVLEKHGWQKNALTEARLMDSFIKETQRLKPSFIASMQRLATADVALTPDLFLPKGTSIAIPGWEMWDSDNYENPSEFDGARYAKLRQQKGFEHSSQFVATGQMHTGFGHGLHACPGRFFASNSIKVAMMHLVMKYDIQLEDAAKADWLEYGNTLIASPTAQLKIRARKAEIDIDRLL